MSSPPHGVLPWVVRRTRLPLLLSRRCVDCRAESATTGEGRFRVNANGKLLDVWLLARCVSCGRTSKLTVHERAPARSFDPSQLDGYRGNDPELVASTLLDPLLARRNHVTLDWTGAWRLDTPPAWPDEAWPVQVEVVFQDPVPVRPDRLIAQGLGLSRNAALRRITCDIPLRRPVSTGFTFTVMAGTSGDAAATSSATPTTARAPPASAAEPAAAARSRRRQARHDPGPPPARRAHLRDRRRVTLWPAPSTNPDRIPASSPSGPAARAGAVAAPERIFRAFQATNAYCFSRHS